MVICYLKRVAGSLKQGIRLAYPNCLCLNQIQKMRHNQLQFTNNQRDDFLSQL